jgi:hypothetical protein
MRKSHFNDEFFVLLGPIISRPFTCSNEEKNKVKKQRVLPLVLSLWVEHSTESPKSEGLSPSATVGNSVKNVFKKRVLVQNKSN